MTEFAVPSARLVGVLSKLYRSNMQRMLINNDLTRFMRRLVVCSFFFCQQSDFLLSCKEATKVR